MSTTFAGSIARDRTTLLAFGGVVLFGGLNAIAVKVSNAELAPLWGAALRFGAGAILLTVLVQARGIRMPRGRALLGTILFGIVNYTVFYTLIYHALLDVPAGMAMVLLSMAPLLTLILAAAIGQERLRATAVSGAVITVIGIGVVFSQGLSAGVPLGPALLVVGGAASIAVASIIVKGFPPVDPVVSNAVAMSVGTVGLLTLSAAAAEPWAVPSRGITWLALAHLVALGSVALFVLVVFVIGRWSASASSFAVVLMPLVTVPAAAILTREPVSPGFLLGSAVVLAGVYLGTKAPPPKPPGAVATESASAVATPAP